MRMRSTWERAREERAEAGESAAPQRAPAVSAIVAMQQGAGNAATVALLRRERQVIGRTNGDGPTTTAPAPVPEPQGQGASMKAIRAGAKAHWERLMDYYLRWGYFPWERGQQPVSKEAEPSERDLKRQAEDLREYRRAVAQLRAEAEARPLKELLHAAAERAATDVHWFELMVTAPGQVLEGMAIETPQEIVEAINKQSSLNETRDDLTEEDLTGMSLRDLFGAMLNAHAMSQSCGQSTGLLNQVLSPATDNTHTYRPVDEIFAAVRRAEQLAESSRIPRYVRVEGAGHSFVIEVLRGGRCSIHQSFQSAYTLATNLEHDKAYTVGELLKTLAVALRPNEKDGQPAPEVRDARRDLFASQAIKPKPDQEWQVTEFKQEPGAGERLDQRYARGVEQWAPHLDTPAPSALMTPPEPEKFEGEMTVGYDAYLFYLPVTYAPQASGALQVGQYYVIRGQNATASVRVSANNATARTLTVIVEDQPEQD